MPRSLQTGSVFMIISAARFMGISDATNFIAMVAVNVASTPALIPEPSPSERAVIMRPSLLFFCERKMSPSAPCLYFDTWWCATSINVSFPELKPLKNCNF